MKKKVVSILTFVCLLLVIGVLTFSTNLSGLFYNVFAASDVPVYKDVQDFGAKGDGVTDDTLAIQNAINSIKGTGGTVIFPHGTYVVNGSLTTYGNVIMDGNNSIIDCSKNATPRVFLTVNPSGLPTVPQVNMTPVLQNATVKGNASFIPNPVSYTPGLMGIAFNTAHVNVEHVSFMGFDKTTVFNSNSYIITFDSCTFGYNNYGVYFDGTSKANLGEKIVFSNCSVGNNNYGIYNNLGSLTFEHCSIDYNNVNHIASNNTDLGGTASAVLTLNDCHIETTNAASPVTNPRIINQGRMIITGGDIWDGDGVTTPTIFNNTGQISIDNVMFRVPETGYLATGSGTINVGKLIAVESTSVTRLLPGLSGIRNSDFETGDMSGWKLSQGTAASVTNMVKNKGAFSLSVASTNSLTGTSVQSQKGLLPQGGVTKALVTFYGYNPSNAYSYLHLLILDCDGNTISDVYAPVAPNGSFTRCATLAQIPQGAMYYQLRADVGPNVMGSCYFDDFYLKFE